MFNMKKTGVAAFIGSALLVAAMGAQAQDAVTVNVTGQVVDSTCTLDQKADGVAIDLGQAAVADFAGVGIPAASKDFSLDFHDCGDSVNTITVAANGSADADDANGYASTGDAANVAVELKSGDTFMDAAGVNTVPVTLADGAGSLPFTASMVQSNATAPTVGSVASVVTLNVDYK
ncbi:fimbrial protein [Cedecea sp.]|jgi:type 1 fimbria pilin|uniref:fimbrial protein n=1 Tax=Cedecea sp. TaxID=1970739 RepID=UPI002F42C4C2